MAATPLLLLVVVFAFAQQSDEVAANSVTTGKVVDHDTNPIGAEVTVNYVADKPSAGFLHGDKSWWDKVKTTLQAGAVLAVIIGSTVLLVRRSARRGGASG